MAEPDKGERAAAADREPDRVAFADETLRASSEGQLEYALAASIVDAADCPAIRGQLQGLLLRRQQRLHWREESAARGARLAAAVSDVPAAHLFVVVGAVTGRRQERARRRVLGRLLWELDQRRVTHLSVESRHLERDRNDERAIGAFRNHGLLSRRLRVGFAQPRQEPMLWLPDLLAGAIGDHRNLPGAPHEGLASHVPVITLDPD